MRFELITLAGTKWSGEATEVALKTADGQLGILPHHEPLTAVTVAGPVSVKPKGGATELFASFGGLLEVAGDTTRLLSDEAEHADELIQSEIDAALEKAKQLKATARSKHELHRAQELIDRHAVRLEVVHLRRHHRSGSHH